MAFTIPYTQRRRARRFWLTRKRLLKRSFAINLRIDGFAIFSKAEEISFIDSIRASGSDQALRELFDIFAAKYRLLEAALFQGVRANANLV